MSRVALITGASRGIGRGIAIQLAEAGYDLVLNFARNQAAGEQTMAECRSAAAEAGKSIRVAVCQADISLGSDRARLLDYVRSEMGRLDLLVNNAGVAPAARADLLEATEESFDRLLGINLKGPFFLTQAVARWLIDQRRAAPADYLPQIITVTSISAYTASANRGDYCVSKAGLAMLTPLFAARLADDGVGVFEIRPGIIATDMTGPVKAKYDALIGNGLTPIQRWGSPEDVGRAVRAITDGHFPFSTGEVFNVDGGFHLRRL